jgi:hypothetical protein
MVQLVVVYLYFLNERADLGIGHVRFGRSEDKANLSHNQSKTISFGRVDLRGV